MPFIYTRKHRLFRARNHSVRYEIGRAISGEVRGKSKRKKKKKRGRGKKRTFLHYLENYFSGVWKSIAATITTGEGGRRKGEFIGLTMAEARAHTFVGERVRTGSRRLVTRPRYEEELFGR